MPKGLHKRTCLSVSDLLLSLPPWRSLASPCRSLSFSSSLAWVISGKSTPSSRLGPCFSAVNILLSCLWASQSSRKTVVWLLSIFCSLFMVYQKLFAPNTQQPTYQSKPRDAVDSINKIWYWSELVQ